MASIADLFFSARLEDDKLQVDAKKAGDKAGQTLGQRMSAGIKKGSADLVSGIKLGAGIAAFGGLTAAVSGVTSALGDAIQAAREDEESQARLGAALKANIKDWDGNTAAIEETIASRQRLGFTDEEQRTSLALLVVATNDHVKALKIQRVAMDLARLKGISLEEASSALIKVDGGQFKALKALGIQLPKNATATEALAAVQEAAADSAEAYANTSQGKLLTSQIKVGEAMERLGYILLPIVSEGMVTLADVATEVVNAISEVGEAVASVNSLHVPLVDDIVEDFDPAAAGAAVHDWIVDLIETEAELLGATKETGASVAGDFSDMRDEIESNVTSANSVVDTETRAIASDIKSIGTAATKAGHQVDLAMRGVVTSIQNARDDLQTAAEEAGDAIYGPIIAEGERAVIELEIAEQQRIISSKNSTKEQVADAKLRLAELRKSQIANLALLASYGDKSAKDALLNSIKLLETTENLTDEQKLELKELRAALKLLETSYNKARDAALRLAAVRFDNALSFNGQAPPPKAEGGPVTGGRPYLVGEEGPELFVPGMSGMILPNMVLTPPGGAASGGDTVTYQVNLLDRMEVRSVRDIGAGLRMLGEQGHLGRKR